MTAKAKAYKKATVTVYEDTEHPSRVVVPVM
jgi:hypothetical protein